MKFRKLGIVFCIAAFLFCITACKANGTSTRVANEELERIRQAYPYNDYIPSVASVDYSNFQTWTALKEALDVYAVAVVKLEGEWFTATKGYSPFPQLDVEDVPAPLNSVTGVFHPAKIEKVLWGGVGLDNGVTINLFFGEETVLPQKVLEKTYISNNYYVCFLYDSRTDNYYDVPSFFVEKEDTWHLTGSNILVAASSHIACIDECSGMYLNAFEQKLTTYLGPPDAELIPVEPELQTE